MELFITIFAVLTTLLICGLVLVRTKIEAYVWAFTALCASIILWVISNYIVNNLDNNELLVNVFHHLAYLGGYLTVLSGLLFSYLFPNRQSIKKSEKVTIILIAVSTIIASLLTSVIGEVYYDSGTILYTTGSWLVLYVIGFAITLFYLARNLNRSKYRSKLQRSQAQMIKVAFIISALLGLTLNVVLPTLTNDWSWTYYGPLAVLALLIVICYAIIRHRLFDIRLAAVRTAAYTLSLGVFAALYFVVAYSVSWWFFDGAEHISSVEAGFINMTIAIILAFLFQPIKNFFDRFTNRIFFHNRYDANAFITELGNILTSTTQLKILLDKSLHHIIDTLKSSYGVFVITRDDKPALIASSDTRREFSNAEIDLLDHLCKTSKKRVISVSDIELNQVSIQKIFNKHKVALIISLAHGNNSVGYLILGEHKASGYTKRDISILEGITNELIIAIQNARSLQALRDFNIHLQQSIEAATKELRQSNSKLRKLDETKDEFVSMASHQLRTPLTSVKGYISMVLDGDAGKITKQQHALLSEAFTSSERMVRLISDFLNVSRIQTGKFMIDAHPVDLKTVVGQEVDAMQHLATSHNIKLNYLAPDFVPEINIDEDKTRQVIMNFIDNAIYYSPEASTVTVKLNVNSKYLSLEVHDKGIGVPKDKQAQLFTKFFRADNARKQRPDGTGVGLYLAKKVVEAQGGEIIFHSHSGLGSVFGFKLPLNKK